MNERIWKLYLKVIHGAGVGDPASWTQLDLTMPQLKVLLLLRARKEDTVSSLAELLNTSLSNMTGILDRLESQGYVERIPSPVDRRSVRIKLTGQAEHIFDKMNQSGRAKLTAALRKMSDSEQKAVERGLQILANALDKPDSDAGENGSG